MVGAGAGWDDKPNDGDIYDKCGKLSVLSSCLIVSPVSNCVDLRSSHIFVSTLEYLRSCTRARDGVLLYFNSSKLLLMTDPSWLYMTPSRPISVVSLEVLTDRGAPEAKLVGV